MINVLTQCQTVIDKWLIVVAYCVLCDMTDDRSGSLKVAPFRSVGLYHSQSP